MTDAAGNLCWSGQYDTFGKLQGQTVAGAAKRQGAQYQQPLRYAGQYHYTNRDGVPIVIQEHSLGHTKATALHGAEPHFNMRPIDNLNTGSVPGTHGHYNF